ncbi:MAG: hypothetical protein IAE87_06165 [Rhodobacteraceae bacterium]|jgi:hypothetical protein|nr:hypothetical protein [Paracoccaceae bacterium]
MTRRPPPAAPEGRPAKAGAGAAARDERLKAALKANMARRKAQVRGRAAAAQAADTADNDTKDA